MRWRAAKQRTIAHRCAALTRVLIAGLAFGSLVAGIPTTAWADETDDANPIATSIALDSQAPAIQEPGVGELEAPVETEQQPAPVMAAVRSGAGSPEFSITGQLLGKEVSPDPTSTDTAVCVSQQHTDVNPTTTSANLNIYVPAGDYAVLTFTLPASWAPNSYTYTVYYKGFQPELVFMGADGSPQGVYTEVVGQFVGEQLTEFKTTVLVVPTGQNVPTDYYPSGQSQLASTTGLAVVRVPADTAVALEMSMDLFNTNDLGGEAQLPAVTMTATSDFYTLSNGRVTTAIDSIAIPPFVRIDKNPWWISTPEFYQNCDLIPDSKPTPPVDVAPTIAKSFEPALIQPGGTSTLTITIANNSSGTATGAWSFEDQLPSVYLKGNTNAPVTLRLAPTPNWTTTGCTITNYAAYPGNTTLAAAGNITPGQAACVITVDVVADASAAANYSANNNLGYFDPRNQNFAFPIDLTNTIDTTASPNSGLSGTAAAALRVEVPNLKVDVSPPTITGGTSSSPITATWTITVVNASNMDQNGQFTANDPSEQVPANDVVVTSKLSSVLTKLSWQIPLGTTSETGQVDGLPQGTWRIPTIEAGQFFQATLTGTVTDLASLLAMTTTGSATTLSSTQELVNQVQATIGNLPELKVALLPNEEPNNNALTDFARSWATQHSLAMPADTYRIASVEADSDRWDKESTEFSAAINLSATPMSPKITGVGPIQITYSVTNPLDTTLKNVVITDALLGGVVCTLTELAPNTTESCVGVYDVSALAIKERTNPRPNDTTEGIWWDSQVGQAFLYLIGGAAANGSYQNPATSANPLGSVWTIPESAQGDFTVRAGTAFQIPVLTPGDLGGWLVLPYTGLSGREPIPVRDWLVFAAELTLLAAVGRWVLGSDRVGACGLRSTR